MFADYLSTLDLSALPLSRHQLDRDYLSRKRPELLDELLADQTTRVLVLHKDEALLDADGRLALLAPAGVPAAQLRLYLGKSLADESFGTPFIAAVLADETAESLEPDPTQWGNLRVLGSTLDDLETGLFTVALALANWHRSYAFAPRTGQPTESDQAGWVRRGVEDGREVFPRTDAAVIVGIIDSQDRILLGHNAMWPTNRYSLLAGFVEPGESLESAVAREVFEESGIRVVNAVYLGSQPWPFPASLMLGFVAQVDPDVESTLTPDGAEILDLRWFSREQLSSSLDEIGLPGHTSIARAILEHWYGGPIHDSTEW